MRRDDYKKSLKIIDGIKQNEVNCRVIHYASEGFNEAKDGQSLKIVCIGVSNFETGEVDCFSIHRVAEREGVPSCEIESRYEELEKILLEDYFRYVKENKNCIWLHWKMRDVQHGFKALEHRYFVLYHSEAPYKIPDDKKINISRLLKLRYSDNYIGHERMMHIFQKNDIKMQDFLQGSAEATEFRKHSYDRIQQSVIRKVNGIDAVVKKMINDVLIVDSTYMDIHGNTVQAVFDSISGKWWFWLLSILLGIFLDRLFLWIWGFITK